MHPTKHFPHVSLVAIALISMPFCFFTLGQLVSWLIQVQILLRFIWQCAAVILLRRYRPDIPQPFTMWLYPLPALLSLALWLYIFFSAPARHRLLVRVPGGRGRRVLRLPAAEKKLYRAGIAARPTAHDGNAETAEIAEKNPCARILCELCVQSKKTAAPSRKRPRRILNSYFLILNSLVAGDAPPALRMPSVTMPTFSTPAPLAASMTSTMSP